jgi:hypothetical protein
MLIRLIGAACLVLSIACISRAQDETAFPSDTEVRLLVTQAERAVQQYKPLLDEEAIQLGTTGAEVVAKDREVVHALEIAFKALLRKTRKVSMDPEGLQSSNGWTMQAETLSFAQAQA